MCYIKMCCEEYLHFVIAASEMTPDFVFVIADRSKTILKIFFNMKTVIESTMK